MQHTVNRPWITTPGGTRISVEAIEAFTGTSGSTSRTTNVYLRSGVTLTVDMRAFEFQALIEGTNQ